MANKSKFLKNLLTTASATAVLLSSANVAVATDHAANGTPVEIGIKPGGAAGNGLNLVNNGGVWADGDNVNAAAQTPINTVGRVVFGDANGGITTNADGTVFNIAHDTSYNFAAPFGGGSGLGQTNVISGTSAFGGNYSGNLNVSNGSISITGNIVAGGGSNGALTVSGGTATIGGNVAQNATISGGTGTVSGNIVGDLAVSGGVATVNTVGGSANLTGGTTTIGGIVTGDITVNGNNAVATINAAPGRDLIMGQNGGTATVTGNIGRNVISKGGTATITGNVGQDVIFNTAAGGTVKVTGIITRNVNFNNQASTLVLGNASTITGTVDSTGGTAGTVKIEGDATITGEVGNSAAIALIEVGSGTATLQHTSVKATDIKFVGDGTVSVGDAATTITANILNPGAVDGRGTLKVSGNDATVVGSIGANTATGALKAVQFDTDNTLTVRGPGLWLDELKSNDGSTKGKLIVAANAAGGEFVIAANTQANGITQFKVNDSNPAGATKAIVEGDLKIGSNTVDGLVHLIGAQDNQLILDSDSEIALKSDLAVAVFNSANQVLELREGSRFTYTKKDSSVTATQSIDSTVAGRGLIHVTGNAALDSNIGNGQTINQLVFKTAGKELSSNLTVFKAANGVKFEQNATWELTKNDADITITGAIDLNNQDNVGTITANNLVVNKAIKFEGAIGDVANNKSLKLLEARAGAGIELKNSSAIKKINVGSNDTTVKIGNGGGKSYIIGEFAAQADQGTLEVVADNTTLKQGTIIGSADNKRKAVLLSGGDHTLILENGVNIYTSSGATGGIRNKGTANQGVLNIQGDSTIDGVVGSNATFKEINVLGTAANGNKTATFLSDINLAGNLNIAAGAKAILKGGVVAANIKGAVNNAGTVVFENTEAEIINAVIGSDRLVSVELNGGNLTFEKNVNATELKFTSDSNLTATLKTLGGLANTKFSTTATDRKHNIKLAKELFDANANTLTLNGDIGEAANPFNTIEVVKGTNNNSELKIATTNKIYTDFITSENNANTLVFQSANANIGGIGVVGAQFLTTTFEQNSTVSGAVFSKTINVEAGKTVNFNNSVASTGGALVLKNGATANIGDGFALNAAVNANAAGDGTLSFAGDATINSVIGETKLNAINFNGAAGKNIAVSKAMSANNINFGAGTFSPSENVKLNGATVFNGTNVNLGERVVTLDGGVESKFSGNAEISVGMSDSATAGGLIVSGAGSSLNLNNAAKLTINVTDNAALPSTTQEFELFKATNTATITKITTQDKVEVPVVRDGFVKWTFDVATNKLKRESQAVAKFTEIVKAAGGDRTLLDDISKIADAGSTGNAQTVANDFSNIRKADGSIDNAKIKDAFDRLTNPVRSTAEVNSDIVNTVKDAQVRPRTLASSAETRGVLSVSDAASGVAAGEQFLHGVWAMPFYGSYEQDNRAGSPGYKAKSYGLTVGADTQVNADMTLGLAFTYAKTDVKHKGILTGDKTKGDTYLLSAYGMQQITNEWFVQGSASFGSTRFKNDQKRRTSAKDQVAKSSFDSTTFGVELLAGYDYKIDSITVTPLAGLGYNRFNDGGYTETGTTFQNLTVKKKATDRLDLIAGASVNLGVHKMEGMDIVPELHAFVKQDLIGNDKSVDIRLQGTKGSIASKKAKSNRTDFNVGGNVMAKQGEYEFGAGYDATLASKFVGHQGTLKVRLNF